MANMDAYMVEFGRQNGRIYVALVRVSWKQRRRINVASNCQWMHKKREMKTMLIFWRHNGRTYVAPVRVMWRQNGRIFVAPDRQ